MAAQVLTTVGLAKIAAALAGGPKVQLTHLAVGDAVTTPVPGLTALGHEVWRGALNALDQAPADPNTVRAEGVVPGADGGWTMREAGIFDIDGDLILVARIPDTYKPDPVADGASVAAYIRLQVQIADAAAALQLTTDDSVVLASRQHVDDAAVGSVLFAWEHCR